VEAALSAAGPNFAWGRFFVSVGIPTSSPFPEPAPFAPRRFTVAEYLRMAETGILTDEDHVELLEGVITPKMTRNPPHDAAIMLVQDELRPLLPKGCAMRVQSAVVTDDSVPEPDVAVVRGTARDFRSRHPQPSDTALAIEVAESSLQRDRQKARIYARAGVPTYWIVNLVDEQIEVHTKPAGSADAPAYEQTVVYRRGDRTPIPAEISADADILVDDLLP
jgi:Uma2 family endonuclease